jgi:hypothetical protein
VDEIYFAKTSFSTVNIDNNDDRNSNTMSISESAAALLINSIKPHSNHQLFATNDRIRHQNQRMMLLS